MARPFFVTIEGIEGSGKTTQVGRLAAALRGRGLVVCETREPGGTPVGDEIRNLLLHGAVPMTALSELFLVLAARAEHVERVIRPALGRNEVVICDRFSDSTLAYQAFGRGLPLDVVRPVETAARRGLAADLTIVLDCPPEMGLERTRQRRGSERADRFESEALAFHERVRRGFLELAAEAGERTIVLDSARSSDAVHADVCAAVFDRLAAPPLARTAS